MKPNCHLNNTILIAAMASVLLFAGAFQAVHPLSHIAESFVAHEMQDHGSPEHAHHQLCSQCLLVGFFLALPSLLIIPVLLTSKAPCRCIAVQRRTVATVLLPSIRAPPVTV
ncbi:MAG: hypothetical protein P8X79_17760 [Reinekea sp.]